MFWVLFDGAALVLALVGLPLLVRAGWRDFVSDRAMTRDLRHRETIRNIGRLEKELGIGETPPSYTPSTWIPIVEGMKNYVFIDRGSFEEAVWQDVTALRKYPKGVK